MDSKFVSDLNGPAELGSAPAGNTEVTGDAGVTGTTGDTGNKGNTGTTNTTGLSGSTGSAITMIDNVASSGRPIYTGRSIVGETLTSDSALVGKTFDTITLKMHKSGLPTGTAIIGIFDASAQLKQVIAKIS